MTWCLAKEARNKDWVLSGSVYVLCRLGKLTETDRIMVITLGVRMTVRFHLCVGVGVGYVWVGVYVCQCEHMHATAHMELRVQSWVLILIFHFVRDKVPCSLLQIQAG